MATFWLSFATDEKFLGVAIIDLDNEQAHVAEIIKETIARGCNPGDGSMEVKIIPARKIPDRFKNRLLGKDEVEHLNAGGFLNYRAPAIYTPCCCVEYTCLASALVCERTRLSLKSHARLATPKTPTTRGPRP
jgi:hypothetical protein